MARSADPERPKGADRSQATRAALISLAADLFAERGYAQTSVRDISRLGSLTTGAIYGHFRNKADLLAEAISSKTTDELESQTLQTDRELDYIERLAYLAGRYRRRRQLRALIVQGAAAAQTDEETRRRLRDEQRAHLDAWLEAYERERDRMGIHPEVDLKTAVYYSWAVELGLGVLESMDVEPPRPAAWAEVHNRFARSLQLPTDNERLPRRVRRS